MPGNPDTEGHDMASRTTRLALLLLLSAAPGALAQAPATATQPAPDASPAVQEALGRIEQTSAGIKTLGAELRYDVINGLLGDTQRRFGTLVYSAGPPAGFNAHFNRLVVDGKAIAQDRTYIFDGKWLVEKTIEKQSDAGADKVLKRFTKTQIVAPNAPPEESNPLASGRGPFPLPINMNRAVILARYHVTLVPPDAKDDPANDGQALDTIHLKLVPRPGPRVDFTEAHLWYLKDSLLPRRVRTLQIDPDSGEKVKETDVDLTAPKVNDPVDRNALDTSEPTDSGWDIEVQPWTQR
jgi:hypothetical protein